MKTNTDKVCHICNKEIPPKRGIVLNGFKDADTGQLVCFPCKEKHYKQKQTTAYAHMYSEVPLTIAI